MDANLKSQIHLHLIVRRLRGQSEDNSDLGGRDEVRFVAKYKRAPYSDREFKKKSVEAKITS